MDTTGTQPLEMFLADHHSHSSVDYKIPWTVGKKIVASQKNTMTQYSVLGRDSESRLHALSRKGARRLCSFYYGCT
jgi:hypothetical protein